MPYILYKRNGKTAGTPFIYTSEEINNIAKNSPGETFVFQNTTTHAKITKKGPKVSKR